MKLDVYNKKNEKIDTLEVSEKVFNVRWNPDLVQQVLTAQVANRRETLAHAKGRGEVSGGGKKPWKQKGTGRARHGSTRSPIWVGGGVAHGPKKERNFSKDINIKMRRRALASVLSRKIKDNEIKIVDILIEQEEKPKTKVMAQIIRTLEGGAPKSVLIIARAANKAINPATGNIPNVRAISAASLNVYDILRNKNLIIEKDAMKEIETRYTV